MQSSDFDNHKLEMGMRSSQVHVLPRTSETNNSLIVFQFSNCHCRAHFSELEDFFVVIVVKCEAHEWIAFAYAAIEQFNFSWNPKHFEQRIIIAGHVSFFFFVELTRHVIKPRRLVNLMI